MKIILNQANYLKPYLNFDLRKFILTLGIFYIFVMPIKIYPQKDFVNDTLPHLAFLLARKALTK